MIVYQVIETYGLGVQESPAVDTPLITEVYADYQKAKNRARELWINNTTEDDRRSHWCALHYSVQAITVKE